MSPLCFFLMSVVTTHTHAGVLQNWYDPWLVDITKTSGTGLAVQHKNTGNSIVNISWGFLFSTDVLPNQQCVSPLRLFCSCANTKAEYGETSGSRFLCDADSGGFCRVPKLAQIYLWIDHEGHEGQIFLFYLTPHLECFSPPCVQIG